MPASDLGAGLSFARTLKPIILHGSEATGPEWALDCTYGTGLQHKAARAGAG